ncbi:LPXTG cell wall anchor domain-containing protein [Hymenobacter terricola]|uniref:LPXTG cell wall anchor domain-containing protein n=1 Tax=Hymenobacter terricola TaxID=2819236 RepID=UPI001B303605|nr:LPXTG cell wall anchor domain-containing protein [Hymenobacter terricola]
MKTMLKPPYVSTTRLLLTTCLMFVAGILSWWSWAHTGQGGFKYALVGLVIVAAALAFFGRWKMYGNNRR